MAWRIDNVDLRTVVVDSGILGKDGNTTLSLNIIGVHNPVNNFLILAENSALSEQGIHQGSFAVVNVGDDGYISDVFSFHLHNMCTLLSFG